MYRIVLLVNMKSYPVKHEQQLPGAGAIKSFNFIEHSAGAVGGDGLVHLLPVFTPKYLLSCQWVPVLGPTYSFQLRPEYLFHVWHRTYPICDAPIRDRSVAEIAPKSLFLCVNRRRVRFGSRHFILCAST